ncbi:hypothetical protein [Saccharicrinis sp. GN24d3]|uniref:hypothetical protein n=1 Tax=Saccharicrinis sp. GN24d3 TaxID=3458416 RepID=UPI0040364E10
MSKKVLYRLYYFAAGAFLLALAKYWFVQEFMFMPKFFIVEFISFGLFLSIVYFYDRHIRESISQNIMNEELLKAKDTEHAGEIAKLEEEIKHKKNDGTHFKTGENEYLRISQILTAGLRESAGQDEMAKQVLTNLAKQYELGLGVCYLYDKLSESFSVKATYGLDSNIHPKKFVLGEGLNGQVAADKKCKLIEDVDEDYFNIESCSGSSLPKYIYLLPIVKGNQCIGLIEMATFGHVYINNQWEHLNNYLADAMSL